MAVRIYSTRWCPACWRAKRFLRAHEIDFVEIDINRDSGSALLVMQHNQGKRRVPTFGINGKLYGNPPLRVLGQLLGVES